MRVILLLFFCATLVSCGTPPQTVAITGFDAASGTVIDPINLWRDYTDRSQGIAGIVHHGESVTLLREQNGGALVQKGDGAQGWLNTQFIAR
jgi:uncharacterized protein YgiM (DUF1202 family)